MKIWDVGKTSTNNVINYSQSFAYHSDVVTDLSWSYKLQFLFASCSEDKTIILYDDRQPKQLGLITTINRISAIDFNKVNENIFISGSEDSNVTLWDLRNTKLPLHSFKFHKKEITRVKFSNEHEHYLATSGKDMIVCVWNTKKIFNQMDGIGNPKELEV